MRGGGKECLESYQHHPPRCDRREERARNDRVSSVVANPAWLKLPRSPNLARSASHASRGHEVATRKDLREGGLQGSSHWGAVSSIGIFFYVRSQVPPGSLLPRSHNRPLPTSACRSSAQSSTTLLARTPKKKRAGLALTMTRWLACSPIDRHAARCALCCHVAF